MEANIIVSGVPRIPDEKENTERINQAFRAFLQKYPNSIIEGPTLEAVGKSSQTIFFAVTAAHVDITRAMQTYFEGQLVSNGFYPTSNKEDLGAQVDDLYGKIANSGSKVTYVKDTSAISAAEANIDEENTLVHNDLVSKYGKGGDFIANVAFGGASLPSNDILETMANNEAYIKSILSFFSSAGLGKVKAKLLKKLKNTPPVFKQKVIDYLEPRWGNKNPVIIRISKFAYGILTFGLLVLAFIIYTAVKGKTPGLFMWIFMSLVAGICILMGGTSIYDELTRSKRRKWFNQQLENFKN
ncbi:hypothetical protein [Aureibaculum conchae]|uniref:hypothetical protein n=1 Tax=Aureibaculum sp. 2308TA14-22 TaxID=3108392 RepID=UPI0033935E26